MMERIIHLTAKAPPAGGKSRFFRRLTEASPLLGIEVKGKGELDDNFATSPPIRLLENAEDDNSPDAVWLRLTQQQRRTVLESAMLAHDLGQCAQAIGYTGGGKATKKVANSERGRRLLKEMWPLAPVLEQAGYRYSPAKGETHHE